MITIGSDVHLRTSTMTVLDHDGTKLMRKKLNNDPGELLEFVRQFESPKQFSMETCYNWPVMYELLKDEVDEFHLMHAKKLKSIVESQSKCDGHDSDEMARLTHIGYIPEAHIASADTRQFRRLLRTRVGISMEISSIKNKIHALINANTFYCQRPKNFKDLFCKRGLEYLENLPIPERERFIVDKLLKEIRFLERLRSEFDIHIEKSGFHSDDIAMLETVPAMNGRILKYIVLSEIANIGRFKNSDSIAAYAGLVPRDRSSGDKDRKGHLRTDCNEFLKWAMIEAAIPAMRKDRSLWRYYKEVKARRNSSAARLAVARKLLTSIYHVLKERRPYYYADKKPQVAHVQPLPSTPKA